MEVQTSQERDYDRKVVEMAKREKENAEEQARMEASRALRAEEEIKSLR